MWGLIMQAIDYSSHPKKQNPVGCHEGLKLSLFFFTPNRIIYYKMYSLQTRMKLHVLDMFHEIHH